MARKLYAVRVLESEGGDALGFYYVESEVDLATEVDGLEVDPHLCEYAEIKGNLVLSAVGDGWKFRDKIPDNVEPDDVEDSPEEVQAWLRMNGEPGTEVEGQKWKALGPWWDVKLPGKFRRGRGFG